jgi:hypothetical protein
LRLFTFRCGCELNDTSLPLASKLSHQPQDLLAKAEKLSTGGRKELGRKEFFSRHVLKGGLGGMEMTERSFQACNDEGPLTQPPAISQAVERTCKLGTRSLILA